MPSFLFQNKCLLLFALFVVYFYCRFIEYNCITEYFVWLIPENIYICFMAIGFLCQPLCEWCSITSVRRQSFFHKEEKVNISTGQQQNAKKFNCNLLFCYLIIMFFRWHLLFYYCSTRMQEWWLVDNDFIIKMYNVTFLTKCLCIWIRLYIYSARSLEWPSKYWLWEKGKCTILMESGILLTSLL